MFSEPSLSLSMLAKSMNIYLAHKFYCKYLALFRPKYIFIYFLSILFTVKVTFNLLVATCTLLAYIVLIFLFLLSGMCYCIA